MISYLKCIGNGQITIPKAWRNLLNLENGPIKATLQGNTIVIEAMTHELPQWEISKVRLNSLSSPVQNIILQGRSDYLSGNNTFVSSQELLDETQNT